MAIRPNPSIPEDLYNRVDELRIAEGYRGGINQYIIKILREYVTRRDLSSELRSELEAYIEQCIDTKLDQLPSSERFKELIRALVDDVLKEEID